MRKKDAGNKIYWTILTYSVVTRVCRVLVLVVLPQYRCATTSPPSSTKSLSVVRALLVTGVSTTSNGLRSSKQTLHPYQNCRLLVARLPCHRPLRCSPMLIIIPTPFRAPAPPQLRSLPNSRVRVPPAWKDALLSEHAVFPGICLNTYTSKLSFRLNKRLNRYFAWNQTFKRIYSPHAKYTTSKTILASHLVFLVTAFLALSHRPSIRNRFTSAIGSKLIYFRTLSTLSRTHPSNRAVFWQLCHIPYRMRHSRAYFPPSPPNAHTFVIPYEMNSIRLF